MKRIAFLLLLAAPAFANTDLEVDTATTIVIGPIVDAADATAETGLTISQADVLLWKEGGTTLAQKNEATSCTHRSNGLYTCPLDTTDTNTEGVLTVNVAESGTMVWRGNFNVLSTTYYEAKYTGIEDSGDIAAAVWDEPTSGNTTAGTFGAQVATVLDSVATNAAGAANDANALITTVGTPTDLGSGQTIADNLADIEGQTDDIGAAGAGLTALATQASVNTLDTLLDNLTLGTIVANSTCDSGTTTTCVDATLTQGDDYWKGTAIVFTSGTLAGQASCVYDFVASTDTLTFRDRTTAVTSSHNFMLVVSPACEGVVAP